MRPLPANDDGLRACACVCACERLFVYCAEGYKWGLRCRWCKRRGKRSVTCAAVSRSAPCEFAHPFGGGNATDTTVTVYLNIVKTHALCYTHLYAFYTPPHLPPGKQTSSIPRASTRFSSPPTVNGAKVCTNVGARADPDTGVGRLSQSHPKLQWVRELAIFCIRSRSEGLGVFISIFDCSRAVLGMKRYFILFYFSYTNI